MTTATATRPSTTKTTKPAAEVKYGTSTDDRFRSEDCDHQNGHITKAAATKCAGDADAELTTVPRYWGTTNGARCECRYGHKTADQALVCVGGKSKAKAVKTTATAKPATAKRTLKSSSEGPGRA